MNWHACIYLGLRKFARLALPSVGLLAGFALAGCAISPGAEVAVSNFCNVPKTYLSVEGNDAQPALMASSGTQTFADVLLADYIAQPRRVEPTVSPSMLFLSGGSQHGAFGAGFLDGWASDRPGGLPRFRVVTGISTGAIMATHAFLNRTDDIVANYRIARESEVLQRYVGRGGPATLRGGLTVVRRGAVGDLTPMRTLLRQVISDQVLLDVAKEADAGRSLYIGAVDVDLGKAAIFDLTALAKRYEIMKQNGADGAQLSRVQGCYLDTIVASSSVPLAAPPTFIDNRMYIDGGARFGVISDEIGEAAVALVNAMETTSQNPAPAKPNVYIVINGDLETKVECGKADPSKCSSEPPYSPIGRHSDWTLLKLAQRSVSILINQVYRFSADRIHDRATDEEYKVHLARIEPDLASFSTAIDFPGETAAQPCPVWEDVDAKLEAPLEFHPRYMRCLIIYGAAKAQTKQWACLDAIETSVPLPETREWERRCSTYRDNNRQ